MTDAASTKYRAKMRTEQPEIFKARQKASHIKTNFNMTPMAYHILWVDVQNKTCAICSATESSKWCIDHDHSCCSGRKSCGKCVRSILCQDCNFAIGLMNDDPTRLRKAAEYLESF